MKILHCCLAAFYIDDFSYQENILPKMHKKQGHDVAILASTESYVTHKKLGYLEPAEYKTREGIPIKRIPYVKWLPRILVRKLRLYKGVYTFLISCKPDIIFLHDSQFLSIASIVRYAKKNKDVRIYVDGHADRTNSARNWVSYHILHKIIYRYCAKLIEPYAKKFYGTLASRVDFIVDVYGIDANKVELLVMGVDDIVLADIKRDEARRTVREQYHLGESDFVIISGGKINKLKNIHKLVQAVAELGRTNIKLLLFGSFDEYAQKEISKFDKNTSIINIGWIKSEDVYKYLFASDLAFFPGTHSVLWEQAVGAGLPAVFKKSKGQEHVDVGGNCKFIVNADVKEIKRIILEICDDKEAMSELKRNAEEKGAKKFSYFEIAKQAIEM